MNLNTRAYSPTLSRFISEDPLGQLAGPNPYEYADDDPANLVDPNGTDPILGCAIGAVTSVAFDLIQDLMSGQKTSLADLAGSAIKGCVIGIIASTIPWMLDAAVDWTFAGGADFAAEAGADGAASAFESRSGASSASNGARLSEQLRLTERYGSSGVKELPDGRMRFYGDMTPASTRGEMAGARLVREWDPASGAQRTWYETLDQQGRVRIVRPEDGGPKVHYTFGPDGTYTGQR